MGLGDGWECLHVTSKGCVYVGAGRFSIEGRLGTFMCMREWVLVWSTQCMFTGYVYQLFFAA